jgi:hypothetical protein
MSIEDSVEKEEKRIKLRQDSNNRNGLVIDIPFTPFIHISQRFGDHDEFEKKAEEVAFKATRQLLLRFFDMLHTGEDPINEYVEKAGKNKQTFLYKIPTLGCSMGVRFYTWSTELSLSYARDADFERDYAKIERRLKDSYGVIHGAFQALLSQHASNPESQPRSQ